MPSEEFGTWKDGSSIYKHNKGYYIYQSNNIKEIEYKKYLHNWKPPKSDTRLIVRSWEI